VLAALLTAGLLLAGCATQPIINVKEAREVELSGGLRDRDRDLRSLQTAAIMDYSGGGHHVKAREQLAVRRPASIRVEAMSPLGVALVVAADAGQIAVFNPSQNTLMRGPASAATLERFTRIPMAPEEAVRLLMALSPDTGMLSFPPASITTDRDTKMTTLTYDRPAGLIDDLGFRDRRLVMVRERNRDGAVVYEVRYSDYKNIGALDFPYTVSADFPLAATHITFHYERPIVDGDIPDSAFELSPGPATRQINLSMRAVHGSSGS
jgi:outer membrane lipoprotein-sorting protein